MNSLVAGPQFINAITKKIGLWPPKLVAELDKPCNSGQALLPSFSWENVQPRKQRHVPFVILKQVELNGQPTSSMFSFLVTELNVSFSRGGWQSELTSGTPSNRWAYQAGFLQAALAKP
jgi:hypothetical protein